MVRTYIRKTQRRNYTTEQLNEALQQCRSNIMTLSACSKAYNIPRETLRDHLSGRRGMHQNERQPVGGGGRPTVFSHEQEHQLAECLRTMSRNGFGLSRMEIFDIVQQYVQRQNLVTPFKKGRPGEDWWLKFKKRHQLTIRKPEPLEHLRKTQGANQYVINGFYDLLANTIMENNLHDKPGQIFNCDETSFCHDPLRTKVVAAKGTSCHRYTASTGRDNTTVLACVNAAGDKLPPLVIFKAKNMWNSWIPEHGDFPGTSYVAANKGWMTGEIFLNWFKRSFVPGIGQERPVLLIYDGHCSHITPELITTAIENNIILLKLPPHMSHLLQPLDVCCFRGLKIAWDKELAKWQRNNVGKRPSKSEFSQLLGKVWMNLTKDNIISGFRATGIYDETLAGDLKVNKHAIDKKTQHRSLDVPTPENHNQENLNQPMPNTFQDLLLATIKPQKHSETPIKRRKIGNTAEVLTKTREASTSHVSYNKRSYSPSSGSETEINSEMSITLSEDDIDFEDSSQEDDALNDNNTNINLHDYVLVKFPTKKSVIYYVGQIIKEEIDHECEVSFLRCKNKTDSRFFRPTISDTSSVQIDDIIKKLPPPKSIKRGFITFDVNFDAYNIN